MAIVTSYFQNGQLVKILPTDNCNQYTSRYIISDGQRFDLELASDIVNIPIPIFKSTNHLPSISKSLDYVIYRKAAVRVKTDLFFYRGIHIQIVNTNRFR